MSKRQKAGEISEAQVGEKVLLQGWAQRRRDLGGLIFIDLRDRSGIVQIVFNPEVSGDALQTADTVRSEYVIEVVGEVVKRAESTFNPLIATGEIEVIGSEITVINESKTPPIQIDGHTDISEDVRLKYRFLDLRRKELQETFKLRHKITQSVRNFLNEDEFYEMETPILTKSTPEGARDYLVPSRINGGEFYALPQSPQLFKQLLMISGFEKYYQIARCFRDEDLRADRQPEFTQIDIETSFMSGDEIMTMTEEMLKRVMVEAKDVEITTPFPRIPYDEAMNRYGSDKPDTRFELELVDVAEVLANTSFKVFSSAIESGGKVKALVVPNGREKISRNQIDDLTEYVKIYGAKGLAWLRVEEGDLTGPIAKFLSDEERTNLITAMSANDGDLVFFGADSAKVVFDSLGALRLKLGKELELIDESVYNFLWVTDWPLLEYDEDEDRYTAAHHPFTSPVEEDIEKLATDPANVRANAYDVVLNGYELGGGSLRIYKRKEQDQMFKALGFTEEEAESQFGFLLEALEFGAPPHGGIALGLDRLVMLLAGRTNLRDTILFPKTSSATDLMTNAPSSVATRQLDELHIEVNMPKEES